MEVVKDNRCDVYLNHSEREIHNNSVRNYIEGVAIKTFLVSDMYKVITEHEWYILLDMLTWGGMTS